jgi:hypothetical protein
MRINKDLTALILPDAFNRSRLEADIPRAKILNRVGISTREAQASKDVASASVFREVITVYSIIVLTADGAFERPPGWPTTGTYPGSGTEIDPAEPYYEQKRVHAVFYDGGTGILYEDNYLIDIEAPYSGLVNTLQGIDQSKIVLYKNVLSGGQASALISAKADELTALGVI